MMLVARCFSVETAPGDSLMTEHQTMCFTNHARVRCQQRGIPVAVVRLIREEAEHAVAVGDGCRSLWISTQRLAAMRSVYGELAERARNVRVIERDGCIVTVLKDRGRRGRPYRRAFASRIKRRRAARRPRCFH